MDFINFVLDFFLHLDKHLIAFVSMYGAWTYFLLFMIIFCETGIIFSAILPGDSLLFAAGALTASLENVLNIHILFVLLTIASIIGNCLNYFVGKSLGPLIFRSKRSLIFNPKNIEKTHAFFERYGGKAIIIARFTPIFRTFAPFVAGIGYMTFRQFFIYSVAGAFLWIGTLVYGSYLFGNIPIVKENFSLVILAIIAISIMPALFEILRRKLTKPATR